MGAGLLAKAVDQPMNLLTDTPSSRASPLPQLIFNMTQIPNKQKGPLYSAGLLFVRDSVQNLNTSMSVRIGVAIGIFGFCGSAGLAGAGACLRGASAIGGWLANGLSATDNC